MKCARNVGSSESCVYTVGNIAGSAVHDSESQMGGVRIELLLEELKKARRFYSDCRQHCDGPSPNDKAVIDAPVIRLLNSE